VQNLLQDVIVWFACYLSISAVLMVAARVINVRYLKPRKLEKTKLSSENKSASTNPAEAESKKHNNLTWAQARVFLIVGSLVVGITWSTTSDPFSFQGIIWGMLAAGISFAITAPLMPTSNKPTEVIIPHELPQALELISLWDSSEWPLAESLAQTAQQFRKFNPQFSNLLQKSSTVSWEQSPIAELLENILEVQIESAEPNGEQFRIWATETRNRAAEQTSRQVKLDTRNMKYPLFICLVPAFCFVLAVPIYLAVSERIEHTKTPQQTTDEPQVDDSVSLSIKTP